VQNDLHDLASDRARGHDEPAWRTTAVRISDERFSRDLRRMRLAWRMIGHGARTQTIQRWVVCRAIGSGVYGVRIRRGVDPEPRLRGRSPRQVASSGNRHRFVATLPSWRDSFDSSVRCLWHPSRMRTPLYRDSCRASSSAAATNGSARLPPPRSSRSSTPCCCSWSSRAAGAPRRVCRLRGRVGFCR
jgi:hypothetical protein